MAPRDWTLQLIDMGQRLLHFGYFGQKGAAESSVPHTPPKSHVKEAGSWHEKEQTSAPTWPTTRPTWPDRLRLLRIAEIAHVRFVSGPKALAREGEGRGLWLGCGRWGSMRGAWGDPGRRPGASRLAMRPSIPPRGSPPGRQSCARLLSSTASRT
jgi:hypothetical protein